jgi:hypothetical protein
MALINTTGIMKPVTKLGSAIVMVVEPVANVLEMASESSNAWAIRHSAELAAKNERAAAVRTQEHRDLLRKALARAQEVSLQTDVFCQDVAMATKLGSYRARIHEARCNAIDNISEDVIFQLSKRENLTDKDILRAAEVGFSIKPVSEEDAPKSSFNLDSFTNRG